MRGISKPRRQLTKLFQSRLVLQQGLAPISATQQRKHISSSSDASPLGTASVDIGSIRNDMLTRPARVHLDRMNATNSNLLTTALFDLLPGECFAEPLTSWEEIFNRDTDIERYKGPFVPSGHHLVYFPLRLPGSQLCSDGTDPYHSPHGTPFTRRMWAGGSIQGLRGMAFDDRSAVCLEHIVDVNIRGAPNAEKIFVEVLREYTTLEDFRNRVDAKSFTLRPHPDPTDTIAAFGEDPDDYDIKGITERRTLVFMREPTDEEKMKNLEKGQRIVKAPNKPEYSVTLTPTPSLLFQYSALTYNAHRIHLDRSYCREVEGYQDLLVHGPLSLTLMLCTLQSRLVNEKGQYEFIDNVDYRHLAPLYVNQPMRICVALQKLRVTKSKVKEDGSDKGQRTKAKSNREELVDPEDSDGVPKVEIGRNKWDIWVENHDGGLCVKGTAETVKRRTLSKWDKLPPDQRRI
ncbi:hypothetical protein ANO14919_139290 [Xylariales sp. No.14919]|nr:hypothetical protein F5X98DRAFT_344625 [Xylaria grammica]GAW24345.1 hypothetical protein ANO14919_139290 [Xylariales sp. No.14919]